MSKEYNKMRKNRIRREKNNYSSYRVGLIYKINFETFDYTTMLAMVASYSRHSSDTTFVGTPDL